MGFLLKGYYVGSECREFDNKEDGTVIRWSVNVATGNLAYRVYMKDEFDPKALEGLKIGAVILLSVRVYVSSKGKLSIVDGEVEGIEK